MLNQVHEVINQIHLVLSNLIQSYPVCIQTLIQNRGPFTKYLIQLIQLHVKSKSPVVTGDQIIKTSNTKTYSTCPTSGQSTYTGYQQNVNRPKRRQTQLGFESLYIICIGKIILQTPNKKST